MHVMSRLRIRGFATFAPSLSAISLILVFLSDGRQSACECPSRFRS